MIGALKTVGICSGSAIDLGDNALVKGRGLAIGGIELAYSHVFRGSESIGKLVPRGFSADDDLVDKTCVLLYFKKAEWNNRLLLETERLKRYDDEGLLRSVIAVRRLSDKLATRTSALLEAEIADYLFLTESDAMTMGLDNGHQVFVQSEAVFKNANTIDLGNSDVLKLLTEDWPTVWRGSS